MTDRELDALVAEKVFGWTFFESKHRYWSVSDAANKQMSDASVRSRWFDTYTGGLWTSPWWEACQATLPYYSTSIADAFAVVEAMRGKGWNIATLVQQRSGEWWCSLRKVSDACERCKRDHTDAEAEDTNNSLPRAICVASLRALGVGVEVGVEVDA